MTSDRRRIAFSAPPLALSTMAAAAAALALALALAVLLAATPAPASAFVPASTRLVAQSRRTARVALCASSMEKATAAGESVESVSAEKATVSESGEFDPVVEEEEEEKATTTVDASTSMSNAGPTDVAAYSKAYRTIFHEQPHHTPSPSSIVGAIPSDLRGTYFRSGPAMFSAGSLPPPLTSLVKPKTDPVDDGADGSRMVSHPFEGDGGVLAVTINGGDGGGGGGEKGTSVCSRFRYVRTNAFTNERKRGSKMYDSMESTRSLGPAAAGSGAGNDFPLPAYRHHLQPGLNRKRKNTSNTRTIYWSKKLLSLWEGGLPYKLDALALSTEGRSQLGGVLKESDPFGAGVGYDPVKRRVLFYSCTPDAGRSELKVYEFNERFRPVSEGNGGVVNVELPGFAMFGDIAATENYAVLIQPDVKVNGMQFLMSKEPGKSLDLKRGGAMLHLIPRVGSEKSTSMRTFPIPSDGLSDADVQFANAYESSDGKFVIVDAVRSDPSNVSGKPLSWPWATTSAEYARTVSRKSLWRYTVDVSKGAVSLKRIGDIQAQFGVINPEYTGREDYKYVYAAVGAGTVDDDATPPRGIGKFNVQEGEAEEVWMPEPYEFCGEPMYAPRSSAANEEGEEVAEDDGYILSILYDGKSHESSLVVLSASSISSGPLARVPLGAAIPHGLHGCFASSSPSSSSSDGDAAAWDPDEIRRRAKLADKMEGRGSMWNEVKSDFSGLGLRLDDIEEYFGDVI